MFTFDATQTAGRPITSTTIETLNPVTRAWEVVVRENATDQALTVDDLDLREAIERIGAAPGTAVRVTLRDEDNRRLATLDSRDFLPDFIL